MTTNPFVTLYSKANNQILQKDFLELFFKSFYISFQNFILFFLFFKYYNFLFLDYFNLFFEKLSEKTFFMYICININNLKNFLNFCFIINSLLVFILINFLNIYLYKTFLFFFEIFFIGFLLFIFLPSFLVSWFINWKTFLVWLRSQIGEDISRIFFDLNFSGENFYFSTDLYFYIFLFNWGFLFLLFCIFFTQVFFENLDKINVNKILFLFICFCAFYNFFNLITFSLFFKQLLIFFFCEFIFLFILFFKIFISFFVFDL